MDNNEIKKAVKRLSRLTEEGWKVKWGEPESLFLIDLVESEMSEIEYELETLEEEIEELKAEIKEANKRKLEYTRKLNSQNKIILLLNNLIEKHKNNINNNMTP